jgi:hypothetical protein
MSGTLTKSYMRRPLAWDALYTFISTPADSNHQTSSITTWSWCPRARPTAIDLKVGSRFATSAPDYSKLYEVFG